MIRKIMIAVGVGLFTPALSHAVDLQVVFDGDCPVEVIDHSDSCGNGNSVNYACADNVLPFGGRRAIRSARLRRNLPLVGFINAVLSAVDATNVLCVVTPALKLSMT